MRSGNLTISHIWIKRISIIYLLVPFIIFCIGYLKTYVSASISILFLGLIVLNLRAAPRDDQSLQISRGNLVFTTIGILLWVALSGIGGFAFQNTDFHIRNAIFRDLITYDWPVKFFTNPINPSIPYSLVYYTGFWLPAALIGKLTGWVGANIALYLWTGAGIILTILLLATKIKLKPWHLTLILILFSGMDWLGSLLRFITVPNTPNTLWPPIFHLEWWVPGFQYSSFTTQLFWVFNQAVPAWICMALLFVSADRKLILLIWSFCCFYAPLPALGMFPYVVLKVPKEVIDPESIANGLKVKSVHDFLSRLVKDLVSLFTFENVLGGGIILGISLAYFLSNPQSSQTSAFHLTPIKLIIVVIFLLFEGLILWWILKGRYQANLNWYAAGILLMVIPLINIGIGNDFGMRASIPTLFMLLIWSAETLATPWSRARVGLTLLLCIGALTPIYEIDRSIYRTAAYYISPPTKAQKLAGEQVKIYEPTSFEYDHPYTLTADSFKSLANFDPVTIANFLAPEDHSFFEKYLSK